MTPLAIIGYGAGVVGAVLTLMSKVKNDNLSDLKERVGILEKEREDARQLHLENQKAIANLDGQLKTYKQIPLKKIADSLDSLSQSNAQILSVLENSAVIAEATASDGGLLVKTEAKNPLDVVVKE